MRQNQNLLSVAAFVAYQSTNDCVPTGAEGISGSLKWHGRQRGELLSVGNSLSVDLLVAHDVCIWAEVGCWDVGGIISGSAVSTTWTRFLYPFLGGHVILLYTAA